MDTQMDTFTLFSGNFGIIMIVVCITTAFILIFCVCRKTMESAIVDYKKDKLMREREKQRISQLYQAVPTDAFEASAINGPDDVYYQHKFRNSLQPPSNSSQGSLQFDNRHNRSHSDSEAMTVHELRKQSVNLLSPMKQLRSTTVTTSGKNVPTQIVNYENPEKRLSIRPIATLPTCREASEGEDSPPSFSDFIIYTNTP